MFYAIAPSPRTSFSLVLWPLESCELRINAELAPAWPVEGVLLVAALVRC